jgi:hypothetical protein
VIELVGSVGDDQQRRREPAQRAGRAVHAQLATLADVQPIRPDRRTD